MTAAKTTPKQEREAWCKRCQEREAAPDSRVPLRNPKHEAFCRGIAILKLSPPKSYAQAGFETKNKSNLSTRASALRRKIEVQNRIAAMMELELTHDLKTREWIDDQLKEVVERCMQKEPVLNKSGRPTGDWKFDSGGATKALNLMGKDRGMFVEKVEITGIDAELHGKSSTEILEMVEAAAVELGRDFIKQLGEKVGIYASTAEAAGEREADGEAGNGTPAKSSKPVSTVH